MGVFYEPFANDACCLCGSKENLSGEHKIKASALRRIFGSDAMAIGVEGEADYRLAQGPKSKEFHFPAPVCRTCNDTRTQMADRAFDVFHARVMELLEQGLPLSDVFRDDRYRVGSPDYLNVFRYFAKLMACHFAASGGPRSISVTNFATGDIDLNRILLTIDRDWQYERLSEHFEDVAYAAHGGMAVFCDKVSGHPNAFHSTLTLGPIRYTFQLNINGFERIAIVMFHRDFGDRCRAAFEEAVANPLSENIRKRLNVADAPEN